ncbi:MAG: hypothetical protein RLZ75_1879 [Pseudomonadota bacterium]|jgi:hypothetical protein
MNAPTQTAQIEQCQTTRLNIDFSHRLSWGVFHDDFNIDTLNETVTDMATRARATIEIMGVQFMDSNVPRVSDNGMYYALNEVSNALEDIENTVRAFHYYIDAKNQA